MLEIRQIVKGHVSIFQFLGSLTAKTAFQVGELIDELKELLNINIVLDFNGLKRIDSSGIGSLVSFISRTHASGGKVVISGLSSQPSQVFKFLKLDKAFKKFSKRSEALEYFQPVFVEGKKSFRHNRFFALAYLIRRPFSSQA